MGDNNLNLRRKYVKSTAHKSQLCGFCCKQEGGTLSLVLAGLKLLRKRPANISLKYTRKLQAAGSKKVSFENKLSLCSLRMSVHVFTFSDTL